MSLLDALLITESEYRRAAKKFGPFASDHEGYAVLLEEVDELWEAIKSKGHTDVRDEAVQVAAMAIRFLVDRCASEGGEG